MDKKKIILVGSDHTAALELIYKRELEALGNQVDLIPVQNIFFEYYNKSFINKLLYRLGLSRILEKIQLVIKNETRKQKPSLIIVFKGMEVLPSTLVWIKKQGISICNFNPDHPFVFSGRGSGNSNVTNSIKYFDHYFSYAEDAVFKLKKLGVKSYKIPFGFDNNGFDYKHIKKENEILKLCFLGNADKQRVQFLNDLALLGIEIDVFGENWKSFYLNERITQNSAKYGQNFWDTLQNYAIQLNLLRPHNMHTHNMRSFDIPGSGGIMLAPNTPDHLFFFEPNKEIFLYNDVTEAYQISKMVLQMSFEQRLEIRKLAREKSIKFHCYSFRVKKLLEIVNTT